MTKVNTILTFAAAVTIALTITSTASASHVRRLDVEDSSSTDADWVDGSGDDSASSDGIFTGAEAVKFEQCGGIGYFGTSKCALGYVCVISDPWYAQCLPEDATAPRTTKKRGHHAKVLAEDADLLVEEKDDIFVVPAWEQCGGKGDDFDFTRDDSPSDDEETPRLPCEEGYHCEIVNKWYYQCQPLPNLSGINLWEQCGGEDYVGSTECTTGAVCKFFNDWYSQCVPKEQESS